MRGKGGIQLMFSKGTSIYSRGCTEEGITTGGEHHCTLEGCRGLRIAVRWSSGKITFPCSKGLIVKHKRWQIA